LAAYDSHTNSSRINTGMKYFNIKDVLPEGDYEVIYDGKVVAKFKTLERAQGFMAKYGLRTAIIKFPDFRSKMKADEIAAVEYIVKHWGKKSPF
jgi:hypothetical protein